MEKHFTASALIIKDNKILLLNHKKLGVWLYPGGHVEADETPDEALIREVKEETGLDIEIISNKDDSLCDDIAQVLHHPYCILCEKIKDNHYHNDMVYLAKPKKDTDLVFNADESNDIKYFSEKEIENIKLFPNFRKLLNKVYRII